MQVATYDNIRAYLTFLRDSYRGGYHYSNPAQSVLSSVSVSEYAVDKDGNPIPISTSAFSSYLIPHDGESAASFSSRNRMASYINLVKPVVSAYVDAVSSKPPMRNFGKVTQGIGNDVDTMGSSYDEFVRNVATENCIYGWTFIIVDVQPNDPTKIRFILVDPTKVIFLKTDDFGRIIDFAFVNQAEIANASAPAIQDVVFTRINDGGIHTLTGRVDFSKGFNLDEMEVTNSVPLAPGLRGQIPVVVSYYQRDTSSLVPVGISLVESQAQIGREVYNLQSYSQDILRMSFPQLTYPIKTSNGSLTPEAQIGMGTKLTLTYDSDTNAPSYISPSKDTTDALKAQSDWLIDKAFAAAHLDLNSAAGVNSSGFALTVKSREFENAVRRFAKEMGKFETKLLDLASKILGIQGDPGFSVSYPDKFSPVDMGAALQNAKSVLDLSKEYQIGETAKKEALLFIITNALGLSDEVSQIVVKEVAKANAQPPQTTQLAAPGAPAEPPTQPTTPEPIG